MITEAFKYQHFSTGAVELAPPHDSQRVAEAIEKLLSKFGFEGAYTISATTDSGSNIKKACEELL